jgi:hypothetical protein
MSHTGRLRGNSPLNRSSSGVTILELTVVIAVLLSLVLILFIAARTWKRGSDRAMCILNIQNVQKGVRGYSNLYGILEGGTVLNLKNQVIGMGRFMEMPPICPSNGTYAYGQTSGVDVIPPLGVLYLKCDLEVPNGHVLTNPDEW